MYRTEVTLEDAVAVITLVESSELSAAPNSLHNALHSTFPDDAMMNYRHQGKQLLRFSLRCIDYYSLQLSRF